MDSITTNGPQAFDGADEQPVSTEATHCADDRARMEPSSVRSGSTKASEATPCSVATPFVNMHAGEVCLAPVEPMTRPAVSWPSGACDTHAHVFGPLADHPCMEGSHYTPAPDVSDDDAYFSMLETLHMTRGVLIQPSVYGTDNRLLLSVLSRHPDKLRGVAVVSEHVSDAELARMNDCGVRGIRFNLLYRGGTPIETLVRLASRIAPLGWHVDLLIDGRTLPEIADTLESLPTPVVFDHMAQMPLDAHPQASAFLCLRRLMSGGKAHIKLSGLNRFSHSGGEFPEVIAWRRRLIEWAPSACLWGSDWPHVGVPKAIDTGKLLNSFVASFDDAKTRERVLIDNPAALYGFSKR